ncbi:MAG: hypothetical protein AAFW73_24305 [Bacteroidota bacterium]
MKIRWFVLLFCCSSALLFAQQKDALQTTAPPPSCGTPSISDEEFLRLPWVGDNDKLYQAIREKEALLKAQINNRQHGCNQLFGGEGMLNNPIINVPVYFYVYQESGETGVPSVAQINAVNAHTNNILANSGSQIRLSIHCIRYLISAQYVEVENLHELDGMMQARRDGPGINVHVVRAGYGWGGIYNSGEDAIALLRNTVTNPTAETYAHEVGHFFTLLHTHFHTNRDPAFAAADGLDEACFREAVARTPVSDPNCPFLSSNCNWTGDGFCDTPADPTGDGCVYNETWVDFRGEPYTPDVDNIMSYYGCRNSFSPMQVAAMWNNLLLRLYDPWSNILNGTFVLSDLYEPNNNEGEAIPLTAGEAQIHTIHEHCNNDEDWFVLDPGQSLGNYSVRVERLTNCAWPVASVEVLYENSVGNLVNFPGATISQVNGNFIASVTCQDVSNHELFIRVNDLPGTTGYYRVVLRNSTPGLIQGPASFCSSAQYQVIGIPPGATVQWSTGPGLSFSCTTCPSTTVQGYYAGTFTIRATIIHNGCLSFITKEVIRENTNVPPFSIVEVNPACYEGFGSLGGLGQYRIPNPAPGVTYSWSTNSGWISPTTGAYVNISTTSPHTLPLTVTATGSCGQSRVVNASFIVAPCSGRLGLDLHPNPARDVLRVAFDRPVEGWGEEQGEYQIIVNDLYGKVMYRGVSDLQNLELDVAPYREGVYTLRVLRNGKYVLTNFVVSKD